MDAAASRLVTAAPDDGGGGRTSGPEGGKLGSRRALSAEVEAFVREMIMTGRLRAGDHIRTEKLAEELGISQTPVREGLQALRGQGFLSLEPRRGFRVLELRRSDIQDMFIAQAHLAAELARRATPRLTDRQIEKLAEIHERLLEAADAGDRPTVQELDWEFHRLINHAADSPKLKLLLSVALFYVPRRFFVTTGTFPSAAERAEVLAAIRARDPDRAAEAMRVHIEGYGRVLEEYLDAGGALGSV